MTPRERYLLRKYGITQRQYNSLLKKQNDSCAVCGKHKSKEKRNLCVDHDHKTGQIRGLLCFLCNHRVIGKQRDPELLFRASEYLRQGTGWYTPKKKRKKRKQKKRS